MSSASSCKIKRWIGSQKIEIVAAFVTVRDHDHLYTVFFTTSCFTLAGLRRSGASAARRKAVHAFPIARQ
jgi:hypothetical protein